MLVPQSTGSIGLGGFSSCNIHSQDETREDYELRLCKLHLKELGKGEKDYTKNRGCIKTFPSQNPVGKRDGRGKLPAGAREGMAKRSRGDII
jgi:hypothetical protein